MAPLKSYQNLAEQISGAPKYNYLNILWALVSWGYTHTGCTRNRGPQYFARYLNVKLDYHQEHCYGEILHFPDSSNLLYAMSRVYLVVGKVWYNLLDFRCSQFLSQPKILLTSKKGRKGRKGHKHLASFVKVRALVTRDIFAHNIAIKNKKTFLPKYCSCISKSFSSHIIIFYTNSSIH